MQLHCTFQLFFNAAGSCDDIHFLIQCLRNSCKSDCRTDTVEVRHLMSCNDDIGRSFNQILQSMCHDSDTYTASFFCCFRGTTEVFYILPGFLHGNLVATTRFRKIQQILCHIIKLIEIRCTMCQGQRKRNGYIHTGCRSSYFCQHGKPVCDQFIEFFFIAQKQVTGLSHSSCQNMMGCTVFNQWCTHSSGYRSCIRVIFILCGFFVVIKAGNSKNRLFLHIRSGKIGKFRHILEKQHRCVFLTGNFIDSFIQLYPYAVCFSADKIVRFRNPCQKTFTHLINGP